MPSKPPSDLTETFVAGGRVFDGNLLKVHRDTVRLPDGTEGTREYIRHPGAVAVVALFDDGQVLLERQFRYPLRRVFVEIPAGKLEADEHPLETGKRELLEETGYAARFSIDHAETVKPARIARIKALGGGIAIQNRMAFAGEYFAERYGAAAAAAAPPLRAMLDAGLPVGAGTDATRVSSYNPWLSLYWMVTGRTAGGTRLFSESNCLTREEALRLYTVGSAWFSGDEAVKGRIAPGCFADFAILSADYFTVPEEEVRGIESVLTVTGGEIVYAAQPAGGVASAAVAAAAAPFANLAPPPLPPVSPAWSPVAAFGGYQQPARRRPQ